MKPQHNAAELQKWHKDLLVREETLNKRAKLLEERYSQEAIDILEGGIVAREILNEELVKTNTELEKSIAKNKSIEEESSKEALIAKDTLNKERDISQKELDALKKQIKTQTENLSDIKKDITETRKYRDEQEKKVNETIQEWNSILVEFRKEADNIQDEKTKLSGDIIRLNQDKATFTEEVKKLEDRFITLKDSYDKKVLEYKTHLSDLDIEVGQRKKALDAIISENSVQEQGFKAREKSLKLRENATIAKERELDQKERRLKMNYGLAGLSFSDDKI